MFVWYDKLACHMSICMFAALYTSNECECSAMLSTNASTKHARIHNACSNVYMHAHTISVSTHRQKAVKHAP
jgi:hypothetical protein